MADLVQYDAMRRELELCVRFDEVADIRDKAEALQLYARQRDDRELEVWTSEIKLRACTRIGELVRELDKHQGTRTDLLVHDDDGLPASVGQKLKYDALKDAKIPVRTATRYEELAGGRDHQAQHSARAAAETYFAASRADQTPATMKGLRGAVRGALEATLGPRPARTSKPALAEPVEPIGPEWVDWTTAVKHLAESTADLAALARKSPVARNMLLNEAHKALPRLQEWVNLLEETNAEIDDRAA